MRHRFIGNSYDREAVVEIFGEAAIKKLESLDCMPTDRVMDDDDVEFMSVLDVIDVDGKPHRISAYYYQPLNAVRYTDDLSKLDWEIDDYGVE